VVSLGLIIWGIDLPLGLDPIVFGIFGAGLAYIFIYYLKGRRNTI
jgi:hypothetical protein